MDNDDGSERVENENEEEEEEIENAEHAKKTESLKKRGRGRPSTKTTPASNSRKPVKEHLTAQSGARAGGSARGGDTARSL